MFRKKNQMETFFFNPTFSTMILCNDRASLVLRELLNRSEKEHYSIPYKGRRVFNKHCYRWDVELEQYKGVILRGCYFTDGSGEYVDKTTDNQQF